jgi:hypothetical protein
MIDDATPGGDAASVVDRNRGSLTDHRSIGVSVLAAASILTTISVVILSRQAAAIDQLDFSERAALTAPLSAIAVVLAFASLCRESSAVSWLALGLALFFGTTGQFTDAPNIPWTVHDLCEPRHRSIIARLRHHALVVQDRFATDSRGDLEHLPKVPGADWPKSCRGEPIYVVSLMSRNGKRLDGLICTHKLMTTLDGRSLILPRVPPTVAQTARQ